MNKQAISNALKALQKTVKKHSPEILTGIGIAGMTAAAVMAVKATVFFETESIRIPSCKADKYFSLTTAFRSEERRVGKECRL